MEYVTVQSVLFIKPHCVPIMAELLQKDILEDEELGMDQENRLDVEQMIELLEKHDFKKLKEELESGRHCRCIGRIGQKTTYFDLPSSGKRRSGGSVYGYEQRHERRFDQCADGFGVGRSYGRDVR